MEEKSQSIKGGQLNSFQMDPLNYNDEDEIKSGVNIDADKSTNTFPCLNLKLARIKSKSLVFQHEEVFSITEQSTRKKGHLTFSERMTHLSARKKQLIYETSMPEPMIESRKISSFLTIMVSKRISKLEKFAYFMENFFISHCLVVTLSIVKIIIQNHFYANCWMRNVCQCPTQFQTKVYSAILYFFFHLNLLVMAVSEISIEINFSKELVRKLVFYLFFASSFLFCFVYLLSIDLMNAVPMYGFLILFGLILGMKRLFEWKQVLPWIKHTLKTNTVSVLIFGHYYLMTRIFPQLNSLLIDEFGHDLGMNLIRLYQFFYFKIFSAFGIWLFHLYNNCILAFNYNNYSSTIFSIRLLSVFFVSVPVAGIITMDDFKQWGGWLLIFSYALFVFTYYTRVDFSWIALKKILGFLHLRKGESEEEKSTEESENDVLCSHLISGCLIDLVFLINSRLVVLMITKRWMTFPVHEVFYLNCGFEISPRFTMNNFGAFAIILVNFLISIVVIVYMRCKNEKILDYKKPKKYLQNIYVLFLLHGFFEGCLQSVVGANDINILRDENY